MQEQVIDAKQQFKSQKQYAKNSKPQTKHLVLTTRRPEDESKQQPERFMGETFDKRKTLELHDVENFEQEYIGEPRRY